MRALSIMQPWANAIVYGPKRVENRTWATPQWAIGQEFAIHTSKRPDVAAIPPAGESWPQVPVHLGAVIAVARLVGCHPTPDEDGLSGCGMPHRNGALCSPWAAKGQFHWRLRNIRSLAEPVPCRGALSLWRLPEDVEAKVRAQLTESGEGRQRDG